MLDVLLAQPTADRREQTMAVEAGQGADERLRALQETHDVGSAYREVLGHREHCKDSAGRRLAPEEHRASEDFELEVSSPHDAHKLLEAEARRPPPLGESGAHPLSQVEDGESLGGGEAARRLVGPRSDHEGALLGDREPHA